MRPSAAHDAKLLLEAHLAEYERIWAEVFSRFESQRQAFAFVVGIFGTLVTIITSIESPEIAESSAVFKSLSQVDPLLLFWAPLIIAPFGFIFFDNELMIWGIVRYTRNHLHDSIRALVDDASVHLMEKSRFPDPKTRTCHFALSLSRWALFILPIVVSMSYAIEKRPRFWDSWYVLVFALDLCATGLLLWAMARAAAEQDIWKRLSGQNPEPVVPKPG